MQPAADERTSGNGRTPGIPRSGLVQFKILRYDNLKSAVKKILRGYRREETVRFMAFRSHWGYQSQFCTPGEGHEKGGVEGEVGYFRRNHWVPVPEAVELETLNKQLLALCHADESRLIAEREETVGATMLRERDHLLPLAADGLTWRRSASQR